MIPSQSPLAVINSLIAGRNSEGTLVSMIGDGNSFGNSKEAAAHEGIFWPHEFFRLLIKHKDQIETVLPARFLRAQSELRKVYLPGTSCADLSESALEPDLRKEYTTILNKYKNTDKEAFVQSGYFRQFLNRYPKATCFIQK